MRIVFLSLISIVVFILLIWTNKFYEQKLFDYSGDKLIPYFQGYKT